MPSSRPLWKIGFQIGQVCRSGAIYQGFLPWGASEGGLAPPFARLADRGRSAPGGRLPEAFVGLWSVFIYLRLLDDSLY